MFSPTEQSGIGKGMAQVTSLPCNAIAKKIMINAKNIMSHEQKSVESSKNSFFLDEKNSERE
jgi:hypothetical protein